MSDIDEYIQMHEHMADIAIKATDRPETAPGVMLELVAKLQESGGDFALLLHCAIVKAEDRALRGEVPDAPADSVRTEGAQ